MTEEGSIKSFGLENFKLFKGLPRNLVYEIKQQHPPVLLKKGEYIIKKGESNRALHLLIEGKAEVYLDERDEPLKTIHAGSIAGEISFIDENYASASIICLCPCKVVIIYEKLLWKLISEYHDFTINLLQLVVNHFRGLNSQAEFSNERRRLSEYQAYTDSLTGLYNRGWLDKKFDLLLNRCKKNQQPFSYLMIDIDFFKKVNDVYGHQIGDFVLQKTSEILTGLARAEDYIVRYGGEEMAILLLNTCSFDAIKVAERLRCEIEETEIEYQEDQRLKITISVGISTLTRDEDSNELIRLADSALYYAKNHGRNQIKFATSNCS